MKTILTIIATVIGLAGFFPYLKDIFLHRTKPHSYTWLIWALTQGTAVAGIWYGGGGWGGLNLALGTLMVVVVFLFSLKYGTKNITKSDTVVLIAAVGAIIVWWQLQQPVLAVLMVSAIDALGYIPSLRKSYQEPWSETIASWLMFAVSDIIALFALEAYNVLTMSYLITITAANILLFAVCMWRRKKIPAGSQI